MTLHEPRKSPTVGQVVDKVSAILHFYSFPRSRDWTSLYNDTKNDAS